MMKHKLRRDKTNRYFWYLFYSIFFSLTTFPLFAQSNIPNIVAFWEYNGATTKEKATLLKLCQNYDYDDIYLTIEEEEVPLGEGIVSVLLSYAAEQDKRLKPEIENILMKNVRDAKKSDIHILNNDALTRKFLLDMNKGMSKSFLDRMKVCWLLDLLSGKLKYRDGYNALKPLKLVTYPEFLQKQGLREPSKASLVKYEREHIQPLIYSPDPYNNVDYHDYVLARAKLLAIGKFAITEDITLYFLSLSKGRTPNSLIPVVMAVLDSWVIPIEREKEKQRGF